MYTLISCHYYTMAEVFCKYRTGKHSGKKELSG